MVKASGTYLVEYSHNIRSSHPTAEAIRLVTGVARSGVLFAGSYTYSTELFVQNKNYMHSGTFVVPITIAGNGNPVPISIRAHAFNGTTSQTHSIDTTGAQLTITKLN